MDDEAEHSLIDCELCHGEGWYWNALLREERPCFDCDGLGFIERGEHKGTDK